MNLFRRDGRQEIEALPAERHGRARHHGMFQQNVQGVTVCELDLFGATKEKGGPKARAQRLGIVVDHIGIAESRNYFVRSQESFLDPPELVRIPDIVLIRQRDDRTLTHRNRFLKVLGRSDVLVVDHKPGGKGRTPSELSYNFGAAVRRPVIADHEFVRRPVLGGDASQLRAEKPPSVKGAHRHRKAKAQSLSLQVIEAWTRSKIACGILALLRAN